ncbi:MAG: hypothetical protein JO117_04085, partial [Verrucomicrobia bacterium]|nr:hypothetical protein [Verrucomicrobiota bacterium]
ELRKDGQPLATAPLVRASAAPPATASTSNTEPAATATTTESGGSARQVFRVDAEGSPTGTTLEVRLLLAGFDALAADNRATLRLPVPRVLRVFVPPTLPTWRRALVALADNSLDLRAAGGGSGSGNDEAVPPETPFDLVITDQPADLSRAAGVVCSVGFVPEDLQRLVEIAPANATNGGGPSVIDWRRDADVLRHVELGDLVLLETPVVRVGATDADFNNLGYEILAQGGRGPLVLERRASAAATSSQTTSSRFVALLFNPDKSTLPYRVGFPVLVANLLDLATRAAGLSEVEATRTGPAANRVGDEASLLSPLETSLASVESIRFNEQITTTAALVPPRRERSLWFPLALGAFALLMVEWWAFHARPG